MARPRAFSFPRVKSIREDLGEGKTKIRYRMKVPAKLRNLSATKIVAKVAKMVRDKHGGGKGSYGLQHFFFTFSGTEFSPYTGQRIGKGTYGTGSKASLEEARREFVSRLKAIKEGVTPGGHPALPYVKAAGYGVFRNGPTEIEAVVMEVPEILKGKIKHRKHEGRAEGSARRRRINARKRRQVHKARVRTRKIKSRR